MISKLSVFVPCHITGFFEIVGNDDPLLKGSRGAGVALDSGVVTTCEVRSGSGNVFVMVNGEFNELNTISGKAVDLIVDMFDLSFDGFDVFIDHEVDLPIGAGFGTSAAFSLGVSLTLPSLFGVNLSFKRAGDIAHLVEIYSSSGLGDVAGEMFGGCVMRLREGSPTNALLDKILLSQPIYVITKTLSSLETSSIIENPVHQKAINSSGSNLLGALVKNPCIENFIELSNRFSHQTNLITPEIDEIVSVLNDECIGSSMAMLGNTAFALSTTPDSPVEKCDITKINLNGIKYEKNSEDR